MLNDIFLKYWYGDILDRPELIYQINDIGYEIVITLYKSNRNKILKVNS